MLVAVLRMLGMLVAVLIMVVALVLLLLVKGSQMLRLHEH